MRKENIRVAVCGAVGKMGTEVVKTVIEHPNLLLVGACDNKSIGEDVGLLSIGKEIGVVVETPISEMLQRRKPDVLVDFTHPDVVFENAMTALDFCHVVVGTTGLGKEQLKQLSEKSITVGRNIVVCPNFAIGAVLMMKMAEMAARFFSDVEIIELHHEKKADAPSGTAIKTAEMIADSRTESPSLYNSKELIAGVRGGVYEDIHIHSVRLPGLIAHQEVIFGGKGQSLSIRHDSYDRTSFMPGVVLAIMKVIELKGLTYGLDKVIKL